MARQFGRGLLAAALLSPVFHPLEAADAAASAALAFPGAVGWAATTAGGRGGEVIKVTSLAADGPGSLQEALSTPGPRIVVFEVGGVIDMGLKTLVLDSPNVTVAGQTAPSPGITIIRGGMDIRAHDAIVQHLRIRPGQAGQRKRSNWGEDAIIDQYSYTPHPQARALALRRSFLIAMIYDNPSPQYVVNMQRGILDELQGTGLQLIIRPCDRGDPDFYEAMQNFVDHTNVSGAILPPSVSKDQKLVDLLTAAGCRCIRIASVVLDKPENTVKTHDSDGAAQAARHLAELGHRNIAHIRGPLTFRSSHERWRGFREVLVEYGIELGPDAVLEAGIRLTAVSVEPPSCCHARTGRPPFSQETMKWRSASTRPRTMPASTSPATFPSSVSATHRSRPVSGRA
jgi:hypothetical protein